MHMQRKLWSCYSKFQTLMLREEGQDLIEYAMVVALIAFAATAGMQAAAGGVNTVFTTIGAVIRNATS
jgi:pilus assembly protein Flp/PilA